MVPMNRSSEKRRFDGSGLAGASIAAILALLSWSVEPVHPQGSPVGAAASDLTNRSAVTQIAHVIETVEESRLALRRLTLGPAAGEMKRRIRPDASLIERFRPGSADTVTLVFDAAAGRPVRLAVLPGAEDRTPTAWTLDTSVDELQPLIAELRELALLRPPASRGRIVRLGDQFAEQLLAPAAAELAIASRVVLFASGPLTELPFAAIRAPRSVDRQGRYLVETRSLCWIGPALADRPGEVVRRPGAAGPVALAVADAIYRPPARPLGASMSDGGISWRQHAARRNQANTVRKLGIPVVSRFGQSASAAALRESTAAYAVRLLHLAVEAQVDPGTPGSSALLLSPRKYDEQPVSLAAGELESELLLQPEALVVLPGLDTGGHGIGPAPFVEAFGAAGAATVVASLWPVVDESATRLFAAFYRELAMGATASAALREAQVHLLAGPIAFPQGEGSEPVGFDAAHPFHWAGYRVYRASAAACGEEAAPPRAAGPRRDLPR